MRRSRLFLAAVALDSLVGDPASLPHPVEWIGGAIAAFEPPSRSFFPRSPAGERGAGALHAGATIALAACTARLLARNQSVAVVLAASSLALRSLLDAARSVERALMVGDLERARERLGRIVGRETAALNESEIARATIETLAESLCDGVAAPAFYLAFGGVAGAYAYKAINTLDSIVGHIEAPYRDFGRFAARFDDLANYIPARLSVLGIALAAHICGGRGFEVLRVQRRDGGLHRSPNAGQCEAAMAGALARRLGGSNRYAGVVRDGAFLGAEFRTPSGEDIGRSIQITALAGACIFIALFAVLFGAERRSGK
ncbi:MAG TPA: adenosylcobinamide-phosphate synthase CbiB [Candidatus Dormibacteraeota bacterium]|nr:adenosylcobinamide-phosphate synthase CbiB [Candidatus Dormibacteraeota bacterium]